MQCILINCNANFVTKMMTSLLQQRTKHFSEETAWGYRLKRNHHYYYQARHSLIIRPYRIVPSNLKESLLTGFECRSWDIFLKKCRGFVLQCTYLMDLHFLLLLLAEWVSKNFQSRYVICKSLKQIVFKERVKLSHKYLQGQSKLLQFYLMFFFFFFFNVNIWWTYIFYYYY